MISRSILQLKSPTISKTDGKFRTYFRVFLGLRFRIFAGTLTLWFVDTLSLTQTSYSVLQSQVSIIILGIQKEECWLSLPSCAKQTRLLSFELTSIA